MVVNRVPKERIVFSIGLKKVILRSTASVYIEDAKYTGYGVFCHPCIPPGGMPII